MLASQSWSERPARAPAGGSRPCTRSMLEKMGNAPLGGLLRFSPPNSTQKFFDMKGLGGGKATLGECQIAHQAWRCF